MVPPPASQRAASAHVHPSAVDAAPNLQVIVGRYGCQSAGRIVAARALLAVLAKRYGVTSSGLADAIRHTVQTSRTAGNGG